MKNARILVVDDLPEMLMVTKMALARSGNEYIVEQASDGTQALMQMRLQKPDLVITDWGMPQMDGIELIKAIRADSQLADIPVVMLTGFMTTAQNLKVAFDAGASDFLRKPFDKTELLARVSSILQLSYSVNEIKKQSQIITKNHLFIKSLIASIPLPFVYYDVNGIILSCNKSYADLFGQDMDLLIGQSLSMIPEYNKIVAINKELLYKNIPYTNYEETFRLADHKDHVFMVSKTILRDECQQPQGIISVLSDVTDIKAAHLEAVEGKKRELVASAIRLVHVSEMNTRLIDDFAGLKKHVDKKGNELIDGLIAKYNINALDVIWKEFEMRFEQVYEDFYNLLIVKHSDLTPNEKKLCALLRLNLSSKEIAALTFQDAKSVDMARYRLRKKLNLAAEANLTDYLMKL